MTGRHRGSGSPGGADAIKPRQMLSRRDRCIRRNRAVTLDDRLAGRGEDRASAAVTRFLAYTEQIPNRLGRC